MGISMRAGRYRYTRWEERDGTAHGVELYDHDNDPGENINRAEDPAYADTAAQLYKQGQAGWQKARPRADAS